MVEDPHFHLAATKDITAIGKRLELDGDLNIELLVFKKGFARFRMTWLLYNDLENVRLQR